VRLPLPKLPQSDAPEMTVDPRSDADHNDTVPEGAYTITITLPNGHSETASVTYVGREPTWTKLWHDLTVQMAVIIDVMHDERDAILRRHEDAAAGDPRERHT
jgi:hypothetical protein